MPMSFETESSVINRAKQRGFRDIKEGESIEEFRSHFADYMLDIDQVESSEIRTGRGWDQQDPLSVLQNSGVDTAGLFASLFGNAEPTISGWGSLVVNVLASKEVQHYLFESNGQPSSAVISFNDFMTLFPCNYADKPKYLRIPVASQNFKTYKEELGFYDGYSTRYKKHSNFDMIAEALLGFGIQLSVSEDGKSLKLALANNISTERVLGEGDVFDLYCILTTNKTYDDSFNTFK